MNACPDYKFWSTFFIFGTAYLAAVIIAWTRHGEPDNQPIGEPSPIRRVLYQISTDLPQLLTDEEKRILTQMMAAGDGLTFQNAARRGMTRATWNKVRANLVTLGLAEYRDGGRIQPRANMSAYLQPLTHQSDMPQNTKNSGHNMTYVDINHLQSRGGASNG